MSDGGQHVFWLCETVNEKGSESGRLGKKRRKFRGDLIWK